MVKPTQIILGNGTVQEDRKKQFEGLQIGIKLSWEQ